MTTPVESFSSIFILILKTAAARPEAQGPKARRLEVWNYSNILFRESITLLFIIPRTVLLSSIQPEAETLTSQPAHFREIFRKSSHQVNTNKGSVVKQSDNDVEGCPSQKVLFQPNMRGFLQYSVILL